MFNCCHHLVFTCSWTDRRTHSETVSAVLMINVKAHLFVYTIPVCRLDCCAAGLQCAVDVHAPAVPEIGLTDSVSPERQAVGMLLCAIGWFKLGHTVFKVCSLVSSCTISVPASCCFSTTIPSHMQVSKTVRSSLAQIVLN